MNASTAHAYSSPYFVDKIPTNLYGPMQVVEKNGVIYIVDYQVATVTKIVNGVREAVAGKSQVAGHTDDGVLATEATLTGPTSIAVANDGTVYIAEPYDHRVRVVYPNGLLGTVAGNGTVANVEQDANDATQTAFDNPEYVKIGPDGLLYVYDNDSTSGVIRRINADGSTSHVVGEFGATDSFVEGGVATAHGFPTVGVGTYARNLFAFAPSGELYLTYQNKIYLVHLDGTIHTFFKPSNISDNAPLEDEPLAQKQFDDTYTGFDIAPDGTIWASFSLPDAANVNGTITTLSAIVYINGCMARTAVGGGTVHDSTTSAYGQDIMLSHVSGVTVGDDGIYFANVGIVEQNNTDTGSYIGKARFEGASTPGAFAWANNPMPTGQTATVQVAACSTTAGGEYYIGDQDPGAGNGTPMALQNNFLQATLGTGLVPGVYAVHVRMQDSSGFWGSNQSDYLVVYDPNSPSVTGKQATVPTLTSGDILPGLSQSGQQEKSNFAFSVKYDNQGVIAGSSGFRFDYNTGTGCNKKPSGCTSFGVNATSLSWLVVDGTNQSEAVYQGVADVTVNGTMTSNSFKVVALDSTRAGTGAADHLTMYVYASGSNPSSATPIYEISDDVVKGSITIR